MLQIHVYIPYFYRFYYGTNLWNFSDSVITQNISFLVHFIHHVFEFMGRDACIAFEEA